jgi:hypothetical protein
MTMANSIQSLNAYCDSMALKSVATASFSEKSDETYDVSLCGTDEDRVDIGMDAVNRSLAALTDKVLKKLKEVLGDQMPQNVGSTIPEEYSPESTSQRIVDGVVGLMSVYAKQNSGKSDEDIISGFMAAVRQGVEQGYGDARDMLDSIDALKIDGVSSTIEETMTLVAKKLDDFEAAWRQEHGLTAGDASQDRASEGVASLKNESQNSA